MEYGGQLLRREGEWGREKVSLSLCFPFFFHGLYTFEITKEHNSHETKRSQKFNPPIHRKNPAKKRPTAFAYVEIVREREHTWEQSCHKPHCSQIILLLPCLLALGFFFPVTELMSIWLLVELIFFVLSLSHAPPFPLLFLLSVKLHILFLLIGR